MTLLSACDKQLTMSRTLFSFSLSGSNSSQVEIPINTACPWSCRLQRSQNIFCITKLTFRSMCFSSIPCQCIKKKSLGNYGCKWAKVADNSTCHHLHQYYHNPDPNPNLNLILAPTLKPSLHPQTGLWNPDHWTNRTRQNILMSKNKTK